MQTIHFSSDVNLNITLSGQKLDRKELVDSARRMLFFYETEAFVIKIYLPLFV